jgi:DNA-binding MarR family transcriptional regulator/N-acetylglutamate synthase-like GNAT family acetyltransferase
MATHSDACVTAVRSFNRFYTRRIGLLNDVLYGSGFSLAENRVLWELAHEDGVVTAKHLEERLRMDGGYLSRILRRFRERGLLRAETSNEDARIRHLVLTGKGRSAFASVNRRSGEEVSATISSLGASGQEELVRAMRAIESLIEPAPSRKTFRLREPRPGDYGWIVHRHGALYAQEHGWDQTFEALVAGLVARFVERFKSGRERCWIAESDGEFVGCVFVVERSRTVAQLRMLLVEPRARGMGVGTALVRQSIAFARAAGYSRMMLWTNDILDSARRIYERAGFRLTSEERHVSFGKRLMGQNWCLEFEARRK